MQTGLRIDHDPDRATDVAPTVQLGMDRDRQAQQVCILAAPDHFLYRTGLTDTMWLRASVISVRNGLNDAIFGSVERDRLQVAIADKVRDHCPTRVAFDVLETDHAIRFVGQRREVAIEINFARDAIDLSRRFRRAQKTPQIFRHNDPPATRVA